MSNISLEITKFRGNYAHLNQPYTHLEVSKLEMMLASITLGFRSWSEPDILSWRSLIHRFGLGLSSISYLEEDEELWRRHSSYAHLDGSEKGAMSYWQGMIFAKVIAEKKLDIPWLIHADSLTKSGQLIRATKSKKGDFMGRDINQKWHSIEAKGRSNSVEKGLIKHAKKQAKSIKKTSPIQATTASVCLSSILKSGIKIRLIDPPIDQNSNSESPDYRIIAEKYYEGSFSYFDFVNKSFPLISSDQKRLSKLKLVGSYFFNPYTNRIYIIALSNEVSDSQLTINTTKIDISKNIDRLWEGCNYAVSEDGHVLIELQIDKTYLDKIIKYHKATNV